MQLGPFRGWLSLIRYTAAVLMPILLTQSSLGQESNRPPIRERIEVDSAIQARQPTGPRDRDWESYLTIHAVGLHALRDPVLRHEFLNAAERRDVETLMDRHFSVVQNIMAASDWPNLAETERREVAARISDLNLISESELVDRLGEDQTQRLRELIVWQAIRHWGLPVLLYGSSLGKELNLSQEQRNEVLEISELVDLEMEERMLAFEKDLIDRIAESLDEGQRKRLKEIFVNNEVMDLIPSMSPDAMLESLKRDYRPGAGSELEKDTHEDKELAREEAMARRWRDGHLPIFDARFRYDGNQLMLAFRMQRSLLDLTPTQEAELASIVEQTRDEIRTLRQELIAQARQNDEGRAQFIAGIRELQEEVDQELRLDILRIDQREQLEALHWLLLIRSRGPLELLVDGSLGDELELTGQQRRDLAGRRTALKRFVEEFIAETHETAFKRFASLLDAKQRRKLEAILGEPPSPRMRGEIGQLSENLKFKMAK